MNVFLRLISAVLPFPQNNTKVPEENESSTPPLKSYSSIHHELKNNVAKTSTHTISPLISASPNNELNYQDITKHFGFPSFKIKTQSDSPVSIIGYKHQIGKYRIKLRLHFFQQCLFLYTYLIFLSYVLMIFYIPIVSLFCLVI